MARRVIENAERVYIMTHKTVVFVRGHEDLNSPFVEITKAGALGMIDYMDSEAKDEGATAHDVFFRMLLDEDNNLWIG